MSRGVVMSLRHPETTAGKIAASTLSWIGCTAGLGVGAGLLYGIYESGTAVNTSIDTQASTHVPNFKKVIDPPTLIGDAKNPTEVHIGLNNGDTCAVKVISPDSKDAEKYFHNIPLLPTEAVVADWGGCIDK
jgi:hypothetical protein